MRYSYIPLLAALVLLGTAPGAHAQGPAPASCVLGTAQADLGINNALGRVFNNGSLFYGNGSAAFYFVPQRAQKSPVYASGLWVGGKVGGQLRVAGGTFGPAPGMDFTFWPGPLDSATGRPVNPASCAAFDRIYSVTQQQIADFVGGGASTADIREWPVQLGAPYFVDTNGNGTRQANEPRISRASTDPGYGVSGTPINLSANQIPDIIGSQGIWWVMNDVGNVHPAQNTPPIGIEVQVLAFSFSRADALGNTTFYKYRIINKSNTTITDTYVSIFADPDLGDAGDDFVGSDVAAGLGYVYNADNVDGSGSGASYGTPPPAVGYDFFQGPIVPDNTNLPADANSFPDTLGTSAFSYFSNINNPTGDPNTGEELYRFQQGLWGDGSTMRAFGTGYQQTQGDPTKFAFPGNPVTNQAWSEVNPGGPPNTGADRRFAIHTGPFVLNNGDVQDVVFGIVYGRGTNNLTSITALRAADQVAQAAYNIDFDIAPPPPPPPACVAGSETLTPGSGRCLEAVELNGTATLVWGYPTSSSNYLGRFEVFNGFLAQLPVADKTYNFEGFNIYRYASSSFDETTRELVATYDVINGVTTIRDLREDPDLDGELAEYISARGTDSGVQYSFNVPNLTNFTDYYYGVSAYAYNEFSTPRANESDATKITVRPARLAGGIEAQSTVGTPLTAAVVNQRGSGTVAARVVDETRITGDTYEVRFFNPTNAAGAVVPTVTTYSIFNTRTGLAVLDGQAFYAQSGEAYPRGNNVAIVDGFTFDVNGPDAGFFDFLTVSNAAGPIVPVQDGAMDPNGLGLDSRFPKARNPATAQTPTVGQQSGNLSRWGFHTGCNSTEATQVITECEYATGGFNFFDRTLSIGDASPGDNIAALSANDYEMRFTAGPNFGYTYFSTPKALISVPFELWDIGTSADAADDVRLFPILNEWGTTNTTTTGNGIFDLGADHPTSGGLNDPQTDLFYWYRPTVVTPGRAGYDAAVAAATAAGANYALQGLSQEVMARMTLVNFNGGIAFSGTYNARMPETGTTFRIVTNNPNQPGDTFTINTAGAQNAVPDAEDIQRSLDRIAAVPNPYFGSSTYESGNLSRVVRFTNLPEQAATIRIFTVSGSLVTTLNKTSSDRSLDWNLETSNNLPVASGMYLVHVDIEGVGERTLKLGVVNRRTQITVF